MRVGVAAGCLAAVAAAACAVAAVAAPKESSPLDGLIVRADVAVAPENNGNWNIPGCPSANAVSRKSGPTSAETIRASSSAVTVGNPLGMSLGGPIDVADVNGQVVDFMAGWWARSPSGTLYQLVWEPRHADLGTCTPIPHDPSGAFPATLKIWACDSRGKACQFQPDGTGCVAFWSSADRTVVTMQVGACTPQAFPPISPIRPPSQSPIFGSSSRKYGFDLHQDAKELQQLPPGRQVFNLSVGAGSTLHLVGPSVNKVARPNATRGANTIWVLTLKRGRYMYYSDAAPDRRKSFIVR
jgi:hypothetical protein